MYTRYNMYYIHILCVIYVKFIIRGWCRGRERALKINCVCATIKKLSASLFYVNIEFLQRTYRELFGIAWCTLLVQVTRHAQLSPATDRSNRMYVGSWPVGLIECYFYFWYIHFYLLLSKWWVERIAIF